MMKKLRAALIIVLMSQVAVTIQAPTTERLLWEIERARLDSLLTGLPSDLDKTTFLRTYCGELIDIGRLDDQTSRFYQSIDFESFRLSHFYSLFRKDRIPAACGPTSYFYIKLLQSFGFKAYQYSFGFKDKGYERFVHSFALVEIEYGGAKRLIIQDPYLNLSYRNQAGEPMDFFEFLSAIKNRRYEEVVMDPSSLTTFLLAPDLALYYPHLSDSCKKMLSLALRRSDGTLKTRIPITRNYDTLMKSPCDDFESAFVNAMRQHGVQEPFLYAYTLRVSEVVGSADHERVQNRIDSVVR
jgi:hypothetical protein